MRFDASKDALVAVVTYNDSGAMVGAIVSTNERITMEQNKFKIDGISVPLHAENYRQVFQLEYGLYPRSSRLVDWLLSGEVIFVSSGITPQRLIDAIYNRKDAYQQFLAALDDGNWPNVIQIGLCKYCNDKDCKSCVLYYTRCAPAIIGA